MNQGSNQVNSLNRAAWIGLRPGLPPWTGVLWDGARYSAQTFRNGEGGEPLVEHGKSLCAAMTTTDERTASGRRVRHVCLLLESPL